MPPERAPRPPGPGTRRRDRAAGAAIIRRDGKLEELDGSGGVILLDALPSLLSLARAILRSDVPSARFLWVEPGQPWLLVVLQPSRDFAANETIVVVELEPLDEPPFGLTRRELDIVTCLAAGFSNPEIADLLVISRRTVSTHLEKILRKLGQRSRAGAAAVAIEQGLLRAPLPSGGSGFEHLSLGRLTKAASGEPLPSNPFKFGRPAARAPLLVGLALPGPMSGLDDADEMLNGALLAIDEINERGGLRGRKLQAVDVSVDIDSTSAILAGFDELISQDVDAILVSYSYVEESSIYAKASEYGCPVLTAMTSESQSEWVEANPSTLGTVFQVAPTERYYGIEFFRLLDRLEQAGAWIPPNRRVAGVETTAASGHLMHTKALELGRDLGWDVAHLSQVAHRRTDWRDLLRYIEDEQPAAVFIAHFIPDEVARFQTAFRQIDSDALVYCIYAPSVPKYLQLAGRDAEGVMWSTSTGTYSDEIGTAFRERYRATYGREPGRAMAGIAFDQVNLLNEAWTRAGNPRSFPQVVKLLRQIVHRGVNGVYALGNPRQTGVTYPFETLDPSVAQAHLVFQIQGGRHRIISPTAYAESQFELPSWVTGAGG